MKKINLLTTIFCGLCALGLQAQETEEDPGEMEADRPDKTEVPSTVTKGFLQLETGFFLEERRDNPRREMEWAYNTTLLRYGLFQGVELRMRTDLVQISEKVNGQEVANQGAGIRPVRIGTKIRLREEGRVLPEIGLLGHLELPFAATRDFKTDNPGVDFRFAFSHTISENADLSYNVGAEWHDDAVDPTYIYTISYDQDLTERFGVYGELYLELEEDQTTEYFWDAGITYLLSQNFQLDAFIGSGINNSQHLWTGAGLTYRMPK